MSKFDFILRQAIGSKQRGLAMLEYGLIGISVVVVTIAGFTILGGSLKDLLGDVKTDASKKIAAPTAAIQKQQQALDDFKAKMAATSALASSGSDQICSASWCISAPGLTGTTVQTAGGNGSQMVNLTNSAANIFAQMAVILAQEGADPSLITLLTNMANQGHDMANAQNGLWVGESDYAGMAADINSMRSGVTNFNNMAAQLNASLSLLPADTRGILLDATNVIIALGDSYNFSGTGNGDEVSWGWSSANIQMLHSNSNTICTNGGDTAVCVQ
jgi:Flp pilus assembly pilin Flp